MSLTRTVITRGHFLSAPPYPTAGSLSRAVSPCSSPVLLDHVSDPYPTSVPLSRAVPSVPFTSAPEPCPLSVPLSRTPQVHWSSYGGGRWSRCEVAVAGWWLNQSRGGEGGCDRTPFCLIGAFEQAAAHSGCVLPVNMQICCQSIKYPRGPGASGLTSYKAGGEIGI